jgi:hypothetical protein
MIKSPSQADLQANGSHCGRLEKVAIIVMRLNRVLKGIVQSRHRVAATFEIDRSTNAQRRELLAHFNEKSAVFR